VAIVKTVTVNLVVTWVKAVKAAGQAEGLVVVRGMVIKAMIGGLPIENSDIIFR
jgi:hypothetical protein